MSVQYPSQTETTFTRMRRAALVPTLLAMSATAMAADMSDVQFHGFASQGYLVTQDADLQGRTSGGGTFDFNEFALNVTATPIDRLRIGLQVFAGDLGKYGNDELHLDWAYGTYQVPEQLESIDLSVSAGRIKSGIGLYGDFRDLDMTRTMVFLPMTVYSLAFRDISIAINGASVAPTFDLGSMGSLELTLAVGGQNFDNEQGTPLADALTQNGVFELDSTDIRRYDIANLNWNTPLEGLRLKGSVMHIDDLTYSGTNAVGMSVDGAFPSIMEYQVGVEYQYDALTLAAEYQRLDLEIDQTIFIPPGTVIATQNETTNQAGYLLATYQVASKWAVGTGYNWAVNDISAPQTAAQQYARSNETRGVALGVRFDPTQHWLIKAEFQRNKGTSLVDYGENATPGLYWNLFAIKTTFDF
jgi:hypothetical protein